jgi:nicotinamide-nucleotide amidase
MKAWIIAVGSEMLTPFRIDTNSLAITERLNAIGYDVRMKFVVGDDVAELSAWFRRAIGVVDLVVCTGGLGPTADDITRDAVAGAFDLPLETDDRARPLARTGRHGHSAAAGTAARDATNTGHRD